ncbi:16S rRNA (guanine(527)-N(7))-methyltransferase RsmG [Puniceibacterium sediminis]|uniref:Ribosomal RNA small subunit methyltransferase G n=1 Tax=Puniceibacterium sediminis TaxID=1608407 RepID=A0A238VRD0_9RHOB|nr:16S rRNA (guanine(527)-N(7))-methyltransferase RsmG [Puniceibacterium sediminis]SNR36912.1 16S rRNA (guanine527-N7)-methyltransferase [Puniceibacterium sediminis]
MTGVTAAEILKNVSRETGEALQIYVDLLKKWNPKINLVSRSTLPDVWDRHVRDSIQIYDLSPDKTGTWVDLGSGGGFPGIIVAILARERNPGRKVTLVESDQRKSTFLRQVLRETGVVADVISERIEIIPPQNAKTISARALSDLTTLCSYADRHLSDDGVALFQKGANWKKEVEDARATWSFSLIEHTSQTDPNAVILQIGDIAHV